jgi:hypothetical protein
VVLDGEPSRREAHLGQLNIALIALAVTCVLALNAIAISQSETGPQRNNLTHGSAAKFRGSASHYGIVHVAMPKGKKAFPAELVPVD